MTTFFVLQRKKRLMTNEIAAVENAICSMISTFPVTIRFFPTCELDQFEYSTIRFDHAIYYAAFCLYSAIVSLATGKYTVYRNTSIFYKHP
jgi:hypothetical protein